MYRIFLLSPAHSGGKRARLLLNPRANFDLARRLHTGQRVSLGIVFTFLSGLYFRGKLAYAKAFACPPPGFSGALVITSNRGLVDTDRPVALTDLRAFSRVPIVHEDPRYRRPLLRDARGMADQLRKETDVILLGSIGTRKYSEILLEAFGDRLRFPAEFVGRGDMSRGGLLLRCAVDQRELEYVPLVGAVRRGKRPAKLDPRTWTWLRDPTSLCRKSSDQDELAAQISGQGEYLPASPYEIAG